MSLQKQFNWYSSTWFMYYKSPLISTKFSDHFISALVTLQVEIVLAAPITCYYAQVRGKACLFPLRKNICFTREW